MARRDGRRVWGMVTGVKSTRWDAARPGVPELFNPKLGLPEEWDYVCVEGDLVWTFCPDAVESLPTPVKVRTGGGGDRNLDPGYTADPDAF